MRIHIYLISKIIIGALFFLSGAYYAVAQETSNTNLLIDTETAFILAVEKDYPPFLFVENDIVKGIAYDYVEIISNKLGKKLEKTEPLQLQQMLDYVKNGQANILADITKTPERDIFLEFSNPYVTTPAVVIARKGEEKVWDVKPANGLRVAVGKGYGVVSFLKKNFPQVVLIELPSDAEVIRAVALGASDVGVLDTGSLSYLLQKEPLSNIEVINETDFSYELSFAVSENNKTVIPLINEAIAKITDQERDQIYSKWLATVPVRQEKLISKKVLLVGGISLGLIFLFLTWNIVLRTIIKKRTHELESAKDGVYGVLKKKIQEAVILKEKAESDVDELKKTKLAMVNILEDVQREKEKVEQITRRLSIATSSAHIGIWDWDVVKNIIVWDDQMYKLYGIKKEDFGGAYEAWQSGLHPDDKKPGDDAIQAALRGEKDFSPQFRVIWPTGEIRYIQAHAVVERDVDGKPLKMVGVNWDITKESIVDREKTEFVSLASHQLKTPIGAIQWDLEMLLDGDYGVVSDKQKEVLNEAYIMSTRMNDLVNALLNISRIEMGVFIIEPKPTDFIELCEEVIKEMEPRRENKEHDLVKVFDKNIPIVPADEKLLRIIFQNFISNAIKYTPDNGKIRVILKTDDENIQFSVANNGEPIPEEDKSRIFTKMFRASNAQEQDPDGNGLGLYLVNQIIKGSGGKIWFTSKKGEDTIFSCSFPLTGMITKTGTKQLS